MDYGLSWLVFGLIFVASVGWATTQCSPTKNPARFLETAKKIAIDLAILVSSILLVAMMMAAEIKKLVDLH